MNRGKKRKGIRFFLLCAVLGALAAFSGAWLREEVQTWETKSRTERWRLETPVEYDSGLAEELGKLRAEGSGVCLWNKKRGMTVQAPELGRQIQANVFWIAGDSGALLMNENVLSVGETGRCLLGSRVAWELFGSMDIAGRKVLVDGKEYVAAGVAFTRENACVCELEPDNGKLLTHAAAAGEGREEAQMLKQRIRGLLGG